MLLPGKNNAKTWLFLTLLVLWIFALSETIGDKTLNLKIGFDLTQGSNGSPSLRIRDFEDSAEFKPRAVDDGNSEEKSSSKPAARADSESNSESEASKEGARSADSDEDNDSYSDTDRQRSTRGLNPKEYEPEENPRIHAHFAGNSDSEDDNTS